MDRPYNQFGDIPEWEGEPQEYEPQSRKVRDFDFIVEETRAREMAEPKSPITAREFWRVILGGLHSEYVDRYDEAGFRGLSLNDDL